MNILIIGKSNSLSWTKQVASSLKDNSHVNVETIYINKVGLLNDFIRNIKKSLHTNNIYSATKILIKKTIKRFNPDIIIVISPFGINIEIIKSLQEAPQTTIKVGWVGDIFGSEHKAIADCFDKLYYTDTHFIELSNKYNFPPSDYLPLAANCNLFYNMHLNKENNLLFIGAYTDKRAELINSIMKTNIRIIGPKWHLINKNITYNDSMIPLKDVVKEYNKVDFVLNIKHESNVVNGLNMRSFEVPACSTCLIQDNVKDIKYNFEIGKEILVYNSTDELNELLSKLKHDKQLIKSVARKGQKKVLNNHTYTHRTIKIINDLTS